MQQAVSAFHPLRSFSTTLGVSPSPFDDPAGYKLSAKLEAVVSAENWHEERDRLVQLLEGIESGKITHIDEDDLQPLQATSSENIALLKARLAKLNARLGDDNA